MAFRYHAIAALVVTIFAVAVAGEEKQSEHVITGTPTNFESLVGDGYTLAGFFAPWCGHCKAIKPAWDKVAELFADENHVKIVSVDADEHKSLGEKYDVQGFPTLKFFSRGSSEPETYEKGRSVEDIVAFLNEKAGTEVSPDGSGSKTAGLLPAVHDSLTGFKDASEEDKAKLLEDAAAKAGSDEESVSRWAVYAKIAHKIIGQGNEYIAREKARLSSIVSEGSSSISAEQRKSFQRRINVLTVFDEL